MADIKQRITEKTVPVQGREFYIEKMDAMTGCYIAMQLVTRSLPAGLSAAMGIPAPATNNTMSKSEFVELQKEILSCVSEKLPSGKVPVFDKAGNLAIIGMDTNAPLLMRLTIDAVQFNFMDFFDVSLWSGLLPPELATILSQLLTSTNFFSLLSREDTGGSTNSGTAPTT